MLRTLQTTGQALQAIGKSPVLETARALQRDLVAQANATQHLINATSVRRSLAENAAIDGAESTSSLVKIAEKQETAMATMAALLGQLVQTQAEIASEQERATKTARRWRWATFVVALSAAGAAVFNVVNGVW
jgi:hypothetical protein